MSHQLIINLLPEKFINYHFHKPRNTHNSLKKKKK